MEVKKNQDYIVTIEDLSVEGEGIGKISEGELGKEMLQRSVSLRSKRIMAMDA